MHVAQKRGLWGDGYQGRQTRLYSLDRDQDRDQTLQTELLRPKRRLGPNVDVNVNVSVEFKVTLHEQVRYMGTLPY